MPKHMHAELMKLYAEDAAETDTPWERWEMGSVERTGVFWSDCKTDPDWNIYLHYRRKLPVRETIMIGDIEVPKPLQKTPHEKTIFYTPYVNQESDYDARLIGRSVCHLNINAAIRHAYALIKISGGTPDFDLPPLEDCYD